MKFFLKCCFLSLLILMGSGNKELSSHPWGGLAVDTQGNIYFTFICPFVDDNHYACVWQIDDQQQLTPVLESSYSPSDIIVARSPDRLIFGAERNNHGGGFQARLWQFDETGKELIIEPVTNPESFFIQAYAVADNGTVFFAKDDKLFQRDTTGSVALVELKDSFTRVDDLAWGLNNKLYILDRGSIKILEENGSVSVLAEGLKEETPEDLPFDGANILFDFSVDTQGNAYVAYYGNRRTLKVTPNGDVSVLLHSEGPWSPHGVDVFNGEVYILESTIGVPRWWELWKEDVIIPRVRKIDESGQVTTVFEYQPE